MQLAAQNTLYGIRRAKQLLNGFNRSLVEVHIGRPLVLWQKTPIRQGERSLDLCIHGPISQLASRQSKFRGRIAEVAFDGIQCNCVVAYPLAPHVTAKRRMAAGSGDLAVPLRVPRDFFDGIPGTPFRPAYRIDEIFERLQCPRFEMNVQHGIPRRQYSRNRSLGRRRFEFACADREYAGIVTVVDLPARRDRQVARRQNFPGRPVHLAAKLEMLKCIAPGLDCVPAQQRIPVKFINRKPGMLDGRKHSCEAHVLDMCVCTKLHPGEAQCHFPFYRSGKNLREEVRHHQPIVVDAVAAATSQSRSVKNVVTQMDIAPRVAARALVLAVRKRSFPPHIDVSSRRQRRTKCLTQVEQLHPSAVAETPFWFCEIRHFRLRIKVRSPGAQHSLLQCESFAPHRKFRREICRHRHHPLGSESDALPFQIPQIQGMLGCPTRVESQAHLPAFDGQRHFHFVVQQPPAFNSHPAHAQSEKRLAQGSLGTTRLLGNRHVGRTISRHTDVHLRFFNQQVAQRYFSPPEGIDLQFRLHLFGRKQRLGSRWLVAVNHQTLQRGSHRKPLYRKGPHFHAAARGFLQTMHDPPLENWIPRSAPKETNHAQNRNDRQYPRRVDHPIPYRVALPDLHFAPSSRNFCTCSRARLSFSQRSACSLMSLCTRASWMMSREASSVGGSCPRVLALTTTAF